MEDLDFNLIKPGAQIGETKHYTLFRCKYNSNYTCSFKHFKATKVKVDILKACSNNINSELKRLKHNPNVERFIGTCFDMDNQFYLVSESIVGKTLAQFIKDDIKSVTFEIRAKICFQLALGLEFLHNSNFVHRNLMAENVILDYEDHYSPKISDISLHEILDTIDSANGVTRTRDELYWKAPEINNLSYSAGSKKADTFGFGLMMWEIISEQCARSHMESILSGNYGSPFEKVPEEFRNIMATSLSIAPEERPSGQELTFCLHPFAGLDEEEGLSDEEGTTELQSTLLSERNEDHSTQLNDEESIYLFNQGMEFLKQKDYVSAAKCFDLPAWNQHAESQYQLGRFHLFGTGRERNLMLATKWLESAANNNHLEAEFLLACLFFHGIRESGRIDKDEAAYLFQKLSKKNHAPSRLYLAYCYEMGIGIDQNIERAVKLYEKCVEEDNVDGIYRLGRMHELGQEVEKNMRTAIELYQRGAVLGNAHCQFSLGRIFELGSGIQKDPTLAYKYLKMGADSHHPEAMYHLGRIYQRGFGVEVDHFKALEYFKKAAELNVSKACHSIGHMYDKGRGVPQDSQEAVAWYLRSAMAGDRLSQNNLARCYHLGTGVEKDMSKAIYWYRRSCDQGVTQAYVNLGRCYEQGTGVEKDYSEAFKYYKAAADQDDPHGIYKMGSCYEEGFGVEKNLEMAIKYYEQAEIKGSDKAKARLNILRKPLPSISTSKSDKAPPSIDSVIANAVTPLSKYDKPLPSPSLPQPNRAPNPTPPSPKGSIDSNRSASKKGPKKKSALGGEDFLNLDSIYGSNSNKPSSPKAESKSSHNRRTSLTPSQPTPSSSSSSSSTASDFMKILPRLKANRLTTQRFDPHSMQTPRSIPNLSSRGSKSSQSLNPTPSSRD